MPLLEAHALSHVVKDRLMARFPQIADAIIHIEPPPDAMARAGRAGQAGRDMAERRVGQVGQRGEKS